MPQSDDDPDKLDHKLADADDLDSMLQAEESEESSHPSETKESMKAASADDLEMMLADTESSEALPSLEDISFEENAPQLASKMVQQWFVQIFQQELGPFEFDAINAMVQEGELSKTDLVRVSTKQDWVSADSIVGLFDGIQDTVLDSTKVMTGNVSPQRSVSRPTFNKKNVESPSETEGFAEEGEAIWYCQIDGQEFGPMPFGKLQGIGETGKLSADDKVRFEGSGGWVLADSIGGLTTSPVQPEEPVPTEQPAPPKVASSPGLSPSEITPSPVKTTPPVGSPPVYSSPPQPYTPPPRPAPKPFSPPKPSKSAGLSLPSIGNPFEKLNADPKILGIVGIILLLGVIYYLIPVFAGLGDGKYYDETKAIYDLCIEAGDNVSSKADELKPRMDAIKAELEEKASSRRPMLRPLLDCYRYYFPKLLSGTEEERKAAILALNERLAVAKSYME